MSRLLYILLGVLFFSTLQGKAQPNRLSLNPDSIDGYWEINMSRLVKCIPTNSPEISFDEVRSLPLKEYDFDSLYFLNHRVLWLNFEIKNNSLSDSLKFFVNYQYGTDIAELYQKKGAVWNVNRAGDHVDYNDLPFKPNNSVIPIALKNGETSEFYLRIYNYQERSGAIGPIVLSSAKMEEVTRKSIHYERNGVTIFSGLFMGSIGLISLYAFLAFLLRKDKAYLYYSLYLFFFFLYYLKSYATHFRSEFQVPILAEWNSNLETPVSIACYLAYLQFVRFFLNLDDAGGRPIKWVNQMCMAFGIFFLLDIAVQIFIGPAYSIKALRWVSPFLILAYAVLLVEIVKTLSSFLSRVFIAGNILMLLPALVMRIADISGTPYDIAAWGTCRVFQFSFGDIPFLHTKTGILLEVVFFLFGLSWKTRDERLEMMNLTLALRSQIVDLQAAIAKPLTSLSPHKETDPFLLKASGIIEQCYADENFSPNLLAEKMHISYKHCANSMKKKTGMSISLYIQKHRLQKAAELLRQPEQNIGEIAYATGFSDPAYFSRQFKQVVGVSPSEYRENRGFQL